MPTLAAGWILDGSGAPPFAGAVSVQGDRISQVSRLQGPSSATPGPAIELDGYSILPGLIDAHSHLGLVDEAAGARPPTATVAALIFENARTALSEGFTTLRDVGGLDGGVVGVIRAGLLTGPRIFPSGPIISQRGGHGDWRAPFDHGDPVAGTPGLVQPSVLVDGPDEMRRVARMAIRDGAVQLKVALSGGFSSDCDQLEDLQFSAEELRAAVEVAHGHHTYVTAHAHHAEAVRLGLLAGVECFEHATFVDLATVEEVHRHQAMLVATLSVIERYQDPVLRSGLRPELVDRAEAGYPAMAEMVRTAVAAGVTVGSGSDQVGSRQTGRGRELAVRSRVTNPLEAIFAATGANARVLRRQEEIGGLRPGLVADLCVIRGDPSADPELFDDPARVELVVLGGRVVKNTLPEPLSAELERQFDAGPG